MELSEEIRSTGSRKGKADDGGSPLSPLETSDEFEDDDMGEYDEERGGDGEESDVSSREEGQEWDVDSFDDGFDYRPKRNLDPNDELGQKMHRYRSQMYRSKVFTFLLQLLIQISSIYTTFDENFGPLIVIFFCLLHEGFDVDRENYPGFVVYRPLVPIDLNKPFTYMGCKHTGELTGRVVMQNMVDMALERYNTIKVG